MQFAKKLREGKDVKDNHVLHLGFLLTTFAWGG